MRAQQRAGVLQSMTREGGVADRGRVGAELRTPRAAAVAGIVFSVLLGGALVLVRLSIPSGEGAASQWLTESWRRTAVAVALNLVPFAGIAFLWFIGVLRDRIGQREDRFFATVFLGSGILFVGMLFVAAATAGGILADAARTSANSPPIPRDALGRQMTNIILNVYAMRMAGVFTITTATIAMRTGVLPRWLAFVGYAAAFVLLVGIGVTPWVSLLFPAWILVLSLVLLVATLRGPADQALSIDGR
jgi:hypothetical protein